MPSKTSLESSWIDRSTNHKTSNIIHYASSDQHKMAMMHLREDRIRTQVSPLRVTYTTIAQSILLPTLDPTTKERIKRKFDFILAKENLLFTKLVVIHDLQEQHVAFLTRLQVMLIFSCTTLQKVNDKVFHQSLSSTKFYSILTDASTDKGRIEK